MLHFLHYKLDDVSYKALPNHSSSLEFQRTELIYPEGCHEMCLIENNAKPSLPLGSSLNHVDGFWGIFDPPSPHCGSTWIFC